MLKSLKRAPKRADICGMEPVMQGFRLQLMQTECNDNQVFAPEGISTLGSSESLPAVIWLTGLSGSGKTTLAEIVHSHIQDLRFPVEHLDGDRIRARKPALGFTRSERIEHIKNVARIASKLESNGSFVVVSLISPYREARDYARTLCKNFVEIFVSTPLFECARRDVKGLYEKAFSGEIPNFTGVSAPYEAPLRPDLAINTLGVSADSCAEVILDHVRTYVPVVLMQSKVTNRIS